jgi:hypothetical protein
MTRYTGPYSLLAFGLGSTAPVYGPEAPPPALGDGSLPDAVVNLTPHPLVYQPHETADVLTIPSHGVARITEEATSGAPLCGWVPDCTGGFSVRDTAFGRIDALPGPCTLADGQRRVFFVVSLVTALALKASGSARRDVLFPAEQVRAPGGAVTSAFRTFGRVA